MYLHMHVHYTILQKKRYINGIAAQKFDYNIRNKHGKNKYLRTIQKNNRSHEYGY